MGSTASICSTTLSNVSTAASLPERMNQMHAFVQWALSQSCSGECSSKQALQLLEQAWETQKLLWQLRS